MQVPSPRAILLALVAMIAAAVIVHLATHDDARPALSVTATVPATPAQVTVPTPAAGDLAPSGEEPPNGGDPAQSELRDETPPGVKASTLHAADDAEVKIADKATLPAVDEPLPVGGAENYTCRRDFSGHVYSARAAGARVMSFKLHYTVSPNVKGWGDVRSVQSYFIRSRVGSAHLIVDFEGHCLQMVPWSMKAWTEGAFNSTSDSVEIVATGAETRAQWLASPLFKRGILAAIVRDRLRARGLPLRFVDPRGCVDRLGYTDHFALECGNDHHDVRPNCATASGSLPKGCSGFPFDVFQAQLSDGPHPVTGTDRITCRKLSWWRAHGRPKGKAEANAVRRRKALDARGVTCTAHGPVRR